MTAEKGGMPRTVQRGFLRSFVAGAGDSNRTFFLTCTVGSVTEAGRRRGLPRVGGAAGVTGTEEKTAFSLSTDTESDLSQI